MGHLETTNDDTTFDFGFPSASGAFTISIWAKGFQGSGTPSAFNQPYGFGNGGGAQNRFWFTHEMLTNTMTMSVFEGGSLNEKNYTLSLASPAVEDWYMFTVTYDGLNNADSLKLYLNNQLDPTPTKNTDDDISAMAPVDMRANLGANGNSGGGFEANHRIYSVATWDKVLSASEVIAIYNGKDPANFPLTLATAAYPSAANLKNWYLPGTLLTGALDPATQSRLGLDQGPQSIDMTAEIGTGVPLDDEVREDFPQPGFLKQTKSLLLDASGELGETSLTTALGVTDTFSAVIWAKNELAVSTGFDSLISWRGFATQDSVHISASNNSVDNLLVRIRDAADTIRQNQRWDNVIDGAVAGAPWHMYVVTWDGTVSGVKLYVDGVDQGASDVNSTDLDGSTMAEQNRDVRIGGFNTGAQDRWVGPIYSAGIYSNVLGSAEVTAMYNSGNARDFNLLENSGSYNSAANLLHYYRLGIDALNMGLDRGLDLLVHDLNQGLFDETDFTTDIPL